MIGCLARAVVVGALLMGGAGALGQPSKAAPSGDAKPAAADTSPVVCEAELDAPVSRVWDVFTTDEGFKLLGVAKAKVDLKVGGKILSHYSTEGVLGDEGTIENTIIAYEPQHVFAFRISKPPKGFPFMNAYKDAWSVATMSALGDGRTHLRLAMCGFTADEESQKMRAFFAQGNQWVLEKLAKNLSGAPKQAPEPAKEVAMDPLAPITCEAAIAAMPDEVWRCWTTTAGIKSFLTDANIDLKINGAYELYFSSDAPVGQRGSEGCTVLSYEPNKMLSFSWNAPPKFPYARSKHTWVVINISPNGPHSAKVTLKHMGFAEQATDGSEHAEEWKQVREYFNNAWPRVLKALQEKYAPAPK